MHFFYPIQQCAQQIHCTALPLSPTSSYLQDYCLQNVIDDQLSYVTAFIGAPSTWGLLLRTIDTRPTEFTCITTSGQGIIAGCRDIVNIYNAVTGVLQQSLFPSEAITKIQASPDGTTLFFAHSSSVTMWDVQTGGLIHTFTTQPKVNDIAVSTSGGHIACGLSDGSVRFWHTRTKKEGKCFGNGQSVVAICWLSHQKLVVATQDSLCIHSVAAGETMDSLSFPNHMWGMVYLADKDKVLVGTSEQGLGVDQQLCSFETVSNRRPEPLEKRQSTIHRGRLVRQKIFREKQSPTHCGQLTHPMIVGKNIVCITPPTGAQLFDTSSHRWTNKPPLLNAATSVAVSLNRNLIVQTKGSIQIFSTDVLTSGEARNDTHVSHVYPLGENHVICVLQPTRHLAVLELETLRELRRDDETLPFRPLPAGEIFNRSHSLFERESVFNIPMAMRKWWQGTTLYGSVELPDEDTPRLVYGLSPAGTKIATASGSGGWDLWVHGAKDGFLVAGLRPYSEGGEVYDLTFDSETRFHIRIYRQGQHVQIPFDITPKRSGDSSPTIIRGEPMLLSEPQATPPYTLDANCEWVLDAQSRKICWIPPGNLRRGNGGHFWAGLWLIMVGGDGVVRKVSFKEPDC